MHKATEPATRAPALHADTLAIDDGHVMHPRPANATATAADHPHTSVATFEPCVVELRFVQDAATLDIDIDLLRRRYHCRCWCLRRLRIIAVHRLRGSCQRCTPVISIARARARSRAAFAH